MSWFSKATGIHLHGKTIRGGIAGGLVSGVKSAGKILTFQHTTRKDWLSAAAVGAAAYMGYNWYQGNSVFPKFPGTSSTTVSTTGTAAATAETAVAAAAPASTTAAAAAASGGGILGTLKAGSTALLAAAGATLLSTASKKGVDLLMGDKIPGSGDTGSGFGGGSSGGSGGGSFAEGPAGMNWMLYGGIVAFLLLLAIVLRRK